ncbi:hypothetical protein QJS10_CPA08g01155 [Acorus calamus]|uniref:Uncharacterized protein n=1 Tax=Acorus calamus TaxID=4465 RepID=A0AAV9EAU7_ACOCL|nr:hypothetical protein QJS10_CPA08g01155 [Acorus calamus]
MENQLEDTGQGRVPYMVNALQPAITEANSVQLNVELVVETQLRDGIMFLDLGFNQQEMF